MHTFGKPYTASAPIGAPFMDSGPAPPSPPLDTGAPSVSPAADNQSGRATSLELCLLAFLWDASQFPTCHNILRASNGAGASAARCVRETASVHLGPELYGVPPPRRLWSAGSASCEVHGQQLSCPGAARQWHATRLQIAAMLKPALPLLWAGAAVEQHSTVMI